MRRLSSSVNPCWLALVLLCVMIGGTGLVVRCCGGGAVLTGVPLVDASDRALLQAEVINRRHIPTIKKPDVPPAHKDLLNILIEVIYRKKKR